jgi:hypothetical protein
MAMLHPLGQRKCAGLVSNEHCWRIQKKSTTRIPVEENPHVTDSSFTYFETNSKSGLQRTTVSYLGKTHTCLKEQCVVHQTVIVGKDNHRTRVQIFLGMQYSNLMHCCIPWLLKERCIC